MEPTGSNEYYTDKFPALVDMHRCPRNDGSFPDVTRHEAYRTTRRQPAASDRCVCSVQRLISILIEPVIEAAIGLPVKVHHTGAQDDHAIDFVAAQQHLCYL